MRGQEVSKVGSEVSVVGVSEVGSQEFSVR